MGSGAFRGIPRKKFMREITSKLKGILSNSDVVDRRIFDHVNAA